MLQCNVADILEKIFYNITLSNVTAIFQKYYEK